MASEAFDYIIIGAGSSGSVLASRLSEDPRYTVLLVESGPPDTSPLIAMPMGIGKLNAPDNPHYWHYNVAMGGNRPEEKWVKGRTLGGSSSINGMVYIRGAPADYDSWEAAGCTGWGWDTMGRCFLELENHELGPSAHRGVGGPLHISMFKGCDPLGDAVISAAAEAGTPTVADINDLPSVTKGGFGRQPRTIKDGKRFSAASAFLKPARGRPNLDIVTDTDVIGIEFDGLRASGVRLSSRGAERSVGARAEIILSAGAINSPKLLQLAGIGPISLLKSLGIEPRIDAPNVGRNLREHRTVSASYKLRTGGHNSGLGGLGLYASALRYFLARRGVLTNSTFDVGGFVKTMPGLDRPDAQIGVGLFSFDAGGVSKHPGMTIFGYYLRPQSQGEVSIRSPDPREAPYINANYMAAEDDRTHTISLIRYIRRIAQQPSLAPLVLSEMHPGPAYESDDELLEASFIFGTSGYHVAGTCRMGSDPGAVLDPQLRVRGIDGLRVVDTSIMPELVSGNTNAPAMAIGWRASELIRSTRKT